MNKKCIALIYEGQKSEKQLTGNLNKCFFEEFTELVPIMFPAGENIYMLWNQLKEDDFETDVIEVLREYNPIARKVLEGYQRNDFMEVYLFFDYDGHTNNAEGCNNGVILEMLETFSDETDLGKLYINYPMVESLRDNLAEEICYRRCWVPLAEAGDYKHVVHEMERYQDFRKYTKQDWSVFCRNAVRKVNCIVNSKYEIPDRDEFIKNMGQAVLFGSQQRKFIRQDKIAVINSFPLFLLEYFKPDFWREVIYNQIRS